MKKFDLPQINTPDYWNCHQTAVDFGLRQQKYKDLIPEKVNSVVELGCGLSPFLAKIDINEKFGVDFSPETIKTCRKNNPDIVYLCEDVRKTSISDKAFDVAVSGEVIEHLENPDELIKEMERISKKRIIISTPILEFQDPEHLWEFDELFFINKGFSTEVIASERFIGRSYIFAWKDL